MPIEPATKPDDAQDEKPKGPPAYPQSQSSDNLVKDLFFGTAERTVQESAWVGKSLHKPFNSDDLYQKTSDYSIYEDMENDDQVSIAMQLKRDLIIGSGWTIVTESEKDQGVADALFVDLEEEPDVSLDDLLEEIIDVAYTKGFSLTEKIFKTKDDGSLALKNLKTRSPNSWLIHTDERGNVSKYEQLGVRKAIDVDPKSLIHYINNPRHQNPYGQSDLRKAYESWFVKRHIIRFYAIFLEKAAGPIPVAKYETNVSRDKVLEVFNIIKNFQTKTALTIPKDFEVEFLQATGAGEAYTKGINLFNMFIGRALVIPDLLGFQGGETGGGSLSLGQSQISVFYKHIQRRRRALERMVNKHLVQPLAVWNHGLMESFPKFVLNPISDDKALDYAKTYLELVKGKVYKPTASEINHFKDLIKFPLSDEKEIEWIVAGSAGGSPLGAPAPKLDDQGNPIADDKSPVVTDDSGGAVGTGEASVQKVALNGAQIASLVEIVSSVAAGTLPRESGIEMIQAAFPFIDQAWAEQIMGSAGSGFKPTNQNPEGGAGNAEENPKASPTGEANPKEVTNPKGEAKFTDLGHFGAYKKIDGDYSKRVDFKALEATLISDEKTIMAEARPIVDEIIEDLLDQVKKKNILGDNAKPERIDTIKLKHLKKLQLILKKNFRRSYLDQKAMARKELFKQNFAQPLPSDRFLEFLDAETFQYVGDWEYMITKRARLELVRAIKDGLPLSTVTTILDDAGHQLSDVSLERYSRTKLTEVMNRARIEEFESSKVVAGYQYSAILDDRTSDICAGLHGKIFKAGDEVVPPAHFNCRSVLIPITIFEEFTPDSKVGSKPIDQFVEENLGEGFSKK